MRMIEALLGRKGAPAGALAALFGPKKAKRHKLPAWAAEKALKKS